MKEAFDAGIAAINFPRDGKPRLFASELTPENLAAWTDTLAQSSSHAGFWKRAVELEVTTDSMLWGEPQDDRHGSAYRRYLSSNLGVHHGLFLTVKAESFFDLGLTQRRSASSESLHAGNVVQLALCRDDPSQPAFDIQSVNSARLLFGAFRSAVRLRCFLEAYRSNLSEIVNHVTSCVAVFGASGQLVYQNRALRNFVSAGSEGSKLVNHLGRLAGMLRSAMKEGIATNSGCGSSQVVQTSSGSYRLFVAVVGEGILMPRFSILGTIENMTERVPSEKELMQAFGLTKQQARVASLLTQRRTNKEVAQELVISPHTARRHTEQVLAKLDVSSRFEVETVVREWATWETSSRWS
jgi:DNA-binding CsgD family transcriptional regulator